MIEGNGLTGAIKCDSCGNDKKAYFEAHLEDLPDPAVPGLTINRMTGWQCTKCNGVEKFGS